MARKNRNQSSSQGKTKPKRLNSKTQKNAQKDQGKRDYSCIKQHLPAQIITYILSKLPVKSLLRFKSVSKTWCSLIDDPFFVNFHFNATRTVDRSTTFISLPLDYVGDRYMLEDRFCIVKGNVKFSEICHSGVGCPGDRAFLVGFSNGLLCWAYSSSISICNPATLDYIVLPDITRPPNVKNFFRSVGFGFHSSTKHFKVLNIFCWPKKETTRYDHEMEAEVQLYTLGSSNSWKKITHVPDRYIECSSGVQVNGSIHWFSYDSNATTQATIHIISFDFETENFGIISIPSKANRVPENSPFVQLGVLDGCLCLSGSRSDGDYEIWILKDYNVPESWIKQFFIRSPFMRDILVTSIKPLSFRKNGELLLICNSKFLVSYHLQLQKVTRVKSLYQHKEIFPYIGNLISPKQCDMLQS